MKHIQKYLQSRWIYLLATAAYFLKHIIFYIQNPNFMYYWDAPGHIQKANITTWPWVGGWDTTFWGGYPTSVYPSLAHAIFHWLNQIISSQTTVGIIFTLLCSGLFIHSLYKTTLKHVANYDALAFASILIISAYMPGYYLGSLPGNLQTGGFAAALATPLLLYFIASNKYLVRGLLLGFLFLTHNITLSAALIFIGVEASINFITFIVKRSYINVIKLKENIFIILIGLLIGTPWITSMLDPSFGSAAQNISRGPQVGFMVIAILISLLVIETKLIRSPLVWFSFIMLILAQLPTAISELLRITKIRGLHFYRYAWFAMITIPISISILLERKHIPFQLSKSTQFAIIMLIPILILLAPLRKQENIINFSFDPMIASMSGRIMDASSFSSVSQTPHLIEHQIVENSNLVGSTGLFYESSPHNILFFTLKTALNQSALINGAPTKYYAEIINNDDEDVLEAARLLGVNYISFSANFDTLIDHNQTYKIGSITKDNQSIILKQIDNFSLIEVATQSPVFDPNIDIGQWWSDTDHKIMYVKTNQKLLHPNISDKTEVKNILIQPMRIRFEVVSDNPVPLLLKFTYSPYWVNQTPQPSIVNQPIWITPGFMYLEANGVVDLIWQPPQYQTTFGKISVATILIVIIAIFLTKNPVSGVLVKKQK